MFVEVHTLEWSKVFFQQQFEARINRPRSRKDPKVTSRDFVLERNLPTCRKHQITEVEEEEASPPSASEEIAATSPVEEMNMDMDLTSRNSNKLPLTFCPS